MVAYREAIMTNSKAASSAAIVGFAQSPLALPAT